MMLYPLVLLLSPLFLAQSSSIGGGFDAIVSVYGHDDWSKMSGLDECSSIPDINGDGIKEFSAADRYDPSLSLHIYSGADGSILRSHPQAWPYSYGAHISEAGDVNKDGIGDYLIGSPNETVNGNTFAGVAYVHSGADGSELYRILGEQASQSCGSWIGHAGDINADGHADFFVASTRYDSNGYTDNGVLRIHSGIDNSVLYEYHGNSNNDSFGGLFSGDGFDLNQDGYDDFIYASNNSTSNIVVIRSGIDGSIIHQNNMSESINKVSFTSDCTGDGVPDYAHSIYNPATSAYEIHIRSGASGFLKRILKAGANVPDRFLTYGDLINAGDLTGNGNPDLAVGSGRANAWSGGSAGAVQIFDLVTGEERSYSYGHYYNSHYGESLSAMGDTNGDGIDDLLISEGFGSFNNLSQNGAVHISTFKPMLTLSAESLSASAGRFIAFEIDFPSHDHGLLYKLLASTSNSSSLLAGLEIPLHASGPVWDALFSSSPPAIFSNPIGRLDSMGDAMASMTVPPGFASAFVGSTIYFAVVNAESASTPHATTVAVGLDIMP